MEQLTYDEVEAAGQRIAGRVRPVAVAPGDDGGRTWQALPERLTAPHLARLDREVLLFHNGAVRAGGADALARFVGSSSARRYQLAAAAAGLPGVRTCARQVYALVAKNRRHMRGRTASCALPRP